VSQPIVSMIPQRHDADCGVAVLAMFLGISYEDALLAIGPENRNVLRSGLWLRQLCRASDSLGVPLRQKRKWDPEEDDGIVQILLPGPVNHFVLLREGKFFNTNFTVWLPEDYFKSRKAKPGWLLVRERDA
jgi:ABC-type bacteriocin/lantibiotic exporter with double-glycine peptidase domain